LRDPARVLNLTISMQVHLFLTLSTQHSVARAPGRISLLQRVDGRLVDPPTVPLFLHLAMSKPHSRLSTVLPAEVLRSMHSKEMVSSLAHGLDKWLTYSLCRSCLER